MKNTAILLLRQVCLALLCFAAPVWAAFDPVNDDTDIFMTNPSVTSERPNVLIILDTSANWNSYFANEKSALISVVGGLSDQYNVGIAMNTGGSIQGSYVRFAIRQMTSGNKSAITGLVNTFSNGSSSSYDGDKTNNAAPGQSMVEAYRYFKGFSSYSATTANAGHDPRTDYAGNTSNSFITTLAGNAFATTPTTASLYRSPVADGCQKNFIIYISNGKGSNQDDEKTKAKDELSSAMATLKTEATAAGVSTTGWTTTATVITPLQHSGNESDSWFDEWAQFLASEKGFYVNVGGSSRKVTANTYVIEVNPGTQNADLQFTDTLKSGASRGKGKYYAASGADPGVAMVNALNAIFSEIQAVNSVFASTTLPVSVNVRGTNLNQVYIGMFRPDPKKQPRWFGNLKLYKLGLASDNTSLQLQDAAGVAAESATTGFITSDARSYWTHSSTFWSYREAEQNGKGGESDLPDGDLVEKGAVAQRLREAYASSQSLRNLYTCTTGCNPCTISGTGSARTCSSPTALSGTPFSTGNTDITASNLNLGTKDVSPLTAKITKTVTALKDRRDVAIANTDQSAAKTITGIDNAASLKGLSALTAFDSTKERAINTLSAGTQTANISVAKVGWSSPTATVYITKGSLTSNPCNGMTSIYISGNNKITDGTYTIGTASNTATTYRSGSSDIAAYVVTFNPTTSGTPNDAGTIYCSGTSQTATATLATTATWPTGLAVGSRINISGASPAAFNGNVVVTAVNSTAKTFQYSLGSAQAAASPAGRVKVYNTVDGSGNYSYSSSTVRATATTSSSHGFDTTDTVVISEVTPSSFNGTYAVKAYTTTTFGVDIAGFNGDQPDATAFGSAYSSTDASTLVTVTATNHGFANNASVDITGVSECFNVSKATITYVDANRFRYSTASKCAPLSVPATAKASGSAYLTTVTATLTNHGFNGTSIVIADGTESCHRGTFTATRVDDNTFTYTNDTTTCSGGVTGAVAANTNAAVGPSGQYTVRKVIDPVVYATSASHGFSTGNTITIAGGNPGGYNGDKTITNIDTNTFSYVYDVTPDTSGATLGTNIGTALTASKNTTTAIATSTNHGFADGSSVLISGATPAAFNGTFNITVQNDHSFTYTLSSDQGDATGTIKAVAGAGSSSERDQVINWVRGQDNNEDENSNGSRTDCRASVHGDVLHSRPAVINYSRYWKDSSSVNTTHGDNDVYVFYGANDGVFRGIKGGTTSDYGDSTSLLAGQEAWGFVPLETFGDLKRLRNNSPTISRSFKRPYFMDGPIGVYTVSTDGKKIDATTSTDKAYLYVGARRGGRYYYSLDVTDPVVPKFRWKIDSTTSGFTEMGQTWSQPTVVTDSDYTKSSTSGTTRPILIFGGGYDPDVEDIENCRITSVSSASYNAGTSTYTAGSVTYYAGDISYTSTGCTTSSGATINSAAGSSAIVSRSKGRAIYIADAITGELIWSAGRKGSGATLEVDGLDYAIPSDVTVVRNESGGNTSRAYVGDTGGNMWRIDFKGTDTSAWTVTRIASIATMSSAAGRRKFLYPPDVVGMSGYDAILVGSGDREHPFDLTVTNRMYMFKDKGPDSGPVTGVDNTASSTAPTILETRAAGSYGSLFDATSNCVQECTGGDLTTAVNTMNSSDGWYVTLATGEKVIGNAVALNGTVFFNTNTPESQDSNSTTCESSLGIARQYQVSVGNASATKDQDASGSKTRSDRYTTHTGGGYLPSPVHVVVDIGGKIYEGVISGTSVQTPTQTPLGTRTRRFWYKEID